MWTCRVILLALAAVNSVAAFNTAHAPSSATTTMTTTTTALSVIDPSSVSSMAAAYLPSVGVALASAAAGAASQFPRIQALEAELETAQTELQSTQEQMQAKLEALEEQLFRMDEEFEAQTSRFQKKYDQEKKNELERITTKLKQDMEFSLQIRVEQEKSRLLTEQHARMHQDDSGSVGQLSTLRLQQVSLEESNEQLESALTAAQTELQNMRNQATLFAEGNKFFQFFRRGSTEKPTTKSSE